jgi:hypothetical protein
MNRLFAPVLFICLAAVALSAASSALAVEFQCSAEPCRYTVKADGTGKSAHHVFIFDNSVGESLSITCSAFSAEATSSTSGSASIALTSLAYKECTAAGSTPVTVRANGCTYGLSAGGEITLECEAGKKLEMELTTTKCIATLGAQGPLKGLTYTIIGEAPRQITVSTSVTTIAASFSGTKAQCLIDPTKTPIVGTYTTANTILTGETDPGGEQVELWLGRPKVLTLNAANGQPAAVNDIVAASLSAGTETAFVLGAGEITCPKSKLDGKVTANPESKADGSGVATIEIQHLTFGECASTVGGAGGEVEELKGDVPWIASSKDLVPEFEIKSTTALQVEITMKLKKPNGEKINCSVSSKIRAKFAAGGKITIAQAFEAARAGCELPTWNGIYKPLKDETKGGKTVVMN